MLLIRPSELKSRGDPRRPTDHFPAAPLALPFEHGGSARNGGAAGSLLKIPARAGDGFGVATIDPGIRPERVSHFVTTEPSSNFSDANQPTVFN